MLDTLRGYFHVPTIHDKITASPVATKPFPHLYVPDLLSTRECGKIIEHWPARSAMNDEGSGLDRTLFQLIADDQICIGQLPRNLSPFWSKLLHGPLTALYNGVADAFAPWIASKFGPAPPEEIRLQIHRLMCLEAESGFIEHTPHTHAGAPNWVITFLLYIDDIGREDRGTTLYEIQNLDIENRIGDVFGCYRPDVKRAFDAPFRRGALIAFFDSAMSVHGSTPFKGKSSERSRRLIRSHISLGPREVETIYGMATEQLNGEMSQAVQRYGQSRSLAEFDGFRLDNDAAMLRALARGTPPVVRGPSKIFFPALMRNQ